MHLLYYKLKLMEENLSLSLLFVNMKLQVNFFGNHLHNKQIKKKKQNHLFKSGGRNCVCQLGLTR